jgi:hypothetical protein
MERQDVEERLARALQRLVERDVYLLENNLSERCIAGRLAMYLQEQFPNHKMDVEYNRQAYPTCGVPAGERCVFHSDAPRSEPHVDPKLSAIEAVQGE